MADWCDNTFLLVGDPGWPVTDITDDDLANTDPGLPEAGSASPWKPFQKFTSNRNDCIITGEYSTTFPWISLQT